MHNEACIVKYHECGWYEIDWRFLSVHGTSGVEGLVERAQVPNEQRVSRRWCGRQDDVV